jgi:hypothetical protein
MAERREYTGGAAPTELSSGISALDMNLSIVVSAGWPTGATGPFVLVIDSGLSTEEKIKCSARSGGNVTVVTRGFDGTTAAAHSAGATVKHVLSANDIDLLNTHAATTTHDDHTQYVHNDNDRTITADHTFSGAPVFSGVPVFNGGASYGSAGNLNAASKNLSITGPNNGFGTGAAGGAGTYLRIGDQGDAATAFVIAAGTPANVGMVFRTKGTSQFQFQAEAGTPWVTVSSTGIKSGMTDNRFGEGAFGTGTYVQVYGDSTTGVITMGGTPTDISLVIMPKGSGALRIEGPTGSQWALFDREGDDLAALETALSVRHVNVLKRVFVGAVDSGGAGYRYLRVVN